MSGKPSVAILGGTGDLGSGLAKRWLAAGYDVTIGSRSAEKAQAFAKELGAPLELVKEVAELGRLPVVNFAAGGIATPADAALMMQLGCDGVFVGSGIFKSGDPARRAAAIVEAVTHYTDATRIAEVSKNLGEPMVGIDVRTLADEELLAARGW